MAALARYVDAGPGSRLKTPAAGAILLHLGIFGSIFLYAFIHGHMHHELWGSDEKQGAIQATLVSNAPALPLPQDQPPTPNVLATDTPSPAPMQEAPQPKAAPVPEPKAIPIPIKDLVKPTPRKASEAPTPKQPPVKEQARASTHPQPVPKQDNRAQYGQAAPQTAQSMADRRGPDSPVTTPGGDFGSRFPWYVDLIKRKVAQNGHQQEVDPGTAANARVYVIFDVSRDGVPSGATVEKTSGSYSLDTACVHAVQRVETFGALPAGYNLSSLRVEYYCDNGALGK